jgi:CBS domain-containing protein
LRVGKLQEVVLELRVGDVMTADPLTVRPEDRMSDLREVLRANRFSGLPVVDDHQLVGIVSVEDFIRCLADRQNGCVVGDKMTREVQTLYEDDSVKHAIGRFEISGLGRFPVIERAGGALVGIVTKGDLARGMLAKLEKEFHAEEARRQREAELLEEVDADAMTLALRYEVAGQDFQRAGEASSRLKRSLAHLGFPPNLVRRVAIACYEAEMNLVIFTAGGSVDVEVRPSVIAVEVRDEGPGIADLDMALQPGYSTAADWVRELGFGAGMGLPNIRKMGDEFDIRSSPGEGTVLSVSFRTDGVER